MPVKRILAVGELLMDDYGDRRFPGGAPANVAAHMARLGIESHLYSAIGNDATGDELLTFLHQHKVDHSLVARVDYPTGRVSVTLKDGMPEYEIVENSAWDNLQYHDIPEADAIYFGTLAQRSPKSKQVIHRLVENSGNALRICDVNLRQNYFDYSVLQWSLSHCDLLKLNDEELPILADLFNLPLQEEGFLKCLSKMFNINMIALTLGKNGSIVYSGNRLICASPYPCNKKNSVGAGDAFTAAFAAGILKRESIESAQQQGNRTAAWVCEHENAVPKD